MAAVAGAAIDNGIGIAGICGKCRIMPRSSRSWSGRRHRATSTSVRTRGHGTVNRRPDDDTYNAGTVVVLRAKPKPHWRFARWEGACHTRRALCRVRLTQSGVTTAVFRLK